MGEQTTAAMVVPRAPAPTQQRRLQVPALANSVFQNLSSLVILSLSFAIKSRHRHFRRLGIDLGHGRDQIG